MPAKIQRVLKVRLISWNATEVIRHLSLLKEAGHRVDYNPEFSPDLLRECRVSPPDAFVIDLSRLPSHGREIAIALRQNKNTRPVPIVFCEGEDEKVATTKALLPDATYCRFSRLRSVLRTLRPAAEPIVPTAMMDRYKTRPTAQKLGIRAGDAVRLIDAPRDAEAAIGPLPDGALFVEHPPAAVTLLFATDPHALRSQLSDLRSIAAETKLWVCWKKGKSTENGVSENLVRETGLSLSLVDYKICSVNQIWSGLAFARKK